VSRDYVGGTLFKYVFAIPVLKDKPSSFACSTCLRNPPKIPTLDAFNNEYALLPDPSLVKKVFRVDMKSKTATFWMDADSVEKMKEKNWRGMILRMDNWLLCSKPLGLRESLRTGNQWVVD
jgi:hypothetical protein